MARIDLSLRTFTLIDDADLHLADGMAWSLSSNGYAISSLKGGGKVRLHRLVCDAPPGMDVDHKNGDRLDNRRDNLRVVTRSENRLNRSDTWPVVSRYVGVYKRFTWDGWFALAPAPNARQVYCGDYADEVAAARAYDAVVRFYNRRADTNFKDVVPCDPRDVLEANGQCDAPLSRYRGVSSAGGSAGRKCKRRFSASIRHGVLYKLGCFETDKDAAQVYDAACLLLGLRDRMNFPKSVPGPAAIDIARQAIFPTAGKVAA